MANDLINCAYVMRLPQAKSWLIGKDSDTGRDWGQEEKGTTEDEMAGWHHWLDGCESEWTPGVGDGQGGLACCDSWGRKESDMTERLNWTELNETPYTNSTQKSFPGGSEVMNLPARKETEANLWGRSSEEGNGYPLQYSFLENFLDRGTWQATVHSITKNQTWMNDFHFQYIDR